MAHILGAADAVLTWLASLEPWLLYLLTSLFTALETTVLLGVLVAGDAVVLLAGSTVDTPGAYAIVVLAATVGSLVGETGGYLTGRLLGPRLRASWVGRRIGEERWRSAERYLAGRGAYSLLAVRFVAFVHAVVPLVAGTVGMPYRRFLAWSATASLVWSMIFTGAGALAGASYRKFGHVSLAATMAAGTMLGVVLLVGRRRSVAARR